MILFVFMIFLVMFFMSGSVVLVDVNKVMVNLVV